MTDECKGTEVLCLGQASTDADARTEAVDRMSEGYSAIDPQGSLEWRSYTPHTELNICYSAGAETNTPSWGDSKRLRSLWGMESFHLPSVLVLSKEIGRLVRHFEGSAPSAFLEDGQKSSYVDTMDYQIIEFTKLDLQMSALQAKKIRENLNKNLGELASMLGELHSRLVDECGLRQFVCFSQKEANYIAPIIPLFGEFVVQKFPSCAFEIEESGRCLGFSRHTAAVFHLMRTLEIAVRSIARCLNIPDPIKPSERNWGLILRTINDEIKTRNQEAPKRWNNLLDKQVFEELHASLDAVRNPWRNTTMHVESKYTEEEAEHIFIAVKGLMKKLASRMDEAGEPKA